MKFLKMPSDPQPGDSVIATILSDGAKLGTCSAIFDGRAKFTPFDRLRGGYNLNAFAERQEVCDVHELQVVGEVEYTWHADGSRTATRLA